MVLGLLYEWLLTLLRAPIYVPQAHGSCSFSLRVFPPRFINPWIDKELLKVFHLIQWIYPNMKH